MPRRITKIDVRVHVMIWQRHLEDRPSEPKYQHWCEKIAEELGVTERDVRTVVTQETESLQYQLNQATATETQKLARRYGLTKEKAFRVMEQGLNATQSELMKGEKGVTLMNEVTNRPRVFTQPDFQSRAKFLDMFSKWAGMNAPEQNELTVRQTNVVELSITDIQSRMLAIARKLVESGGDPRVLDIGRGTEGETGAPEPAVLDVGVHQDQG